MLTDKAKNKSRIRGWEQREREESESFCSDWAKLS